MLKRVGAPIPHVLAVQANLASSYYGLGRGEQALNLRREVYFGYARLFGKEHTDTLMVAENYTLSLLGERRFKETKSLLLKTLPVARRVWGTSHISTLRIRWNYATALCNDAGATLDDLREGVTILEEIEPTMRRVLGGAHPLTVDVEANLREARAALRARETPSTSA